MTALVFERHPGAHAVMMLDTLVEVYIDAHSANPEDTDELFSKPSFISRTNSQVQRDGFELVTATAPDGKLIGFSFGHTFAAGQWWMNCTPEPPESTGHPKFAVIELDVRKASQGQGTGKKLFQTLLSARTEEFATLAAIPGSLAWNMYIRWGWRKAGTFLTPPAMDALMLRMHC